MAMHSSNVLPFSHSVAKEEDAIALPQPNVLNFAAGFER
jgi:hypothetical protein